LDCSLEKKWKSDLIKPDGIAAQYTRAYENEKLLVQINQTNVEMVKL